jgi:hypothetical protein
MTRIPALVHRQRFVLAALALSLAAHAVVIVGVPGRVGAPPDLEAATYAVELAPLPSAAPVPGESPAPRVPRPRSPRKATEAIATLPPLGGTESAADALPALAEMQAPLAPADAPVPEAEERKPELLAAAIPATPVPALEPPTFPTTALPARLSISYALTSAFADGRAEYSWRRDGDRYAISGEAEAVGFFTLFLEGRVLQETTGTVTAEGLKPERFVERKPQGPDEGIEFDWKAKRMEFRRNDEVKPGELADDTVDWLSMIFQLAHAPPKGDSLDMKVYTQRRLYAFTLKVLGVETLELPLGKVQALHLRHATADPKETVDVWLGVDHHYLPVKLRYPVSRNRFTVEQTATSISSR